MIKFAPYLCWGWGYEDLPRFNWVAYMMLDDMCVFSGIDRTKRTSTFNAAAEIIENIAKTERVHWSQRRWFDLHGPWGYPLLLCGQYRFVHLELLCAPVNAREKSDHTLLIDDNDIFVVVKSAKEVSVKDWHLSPPDPKLAPLYQLFERCAAAAKPAT